MLEGQRPHNDDGAPSAQVHAIRSRQPAARMAAVAPGRLHGSTLFLLCISAYGGLCRCAGVIAIPGFGATPGGEEVRYGDPYGLAWQQLGNALLDLLTVVWWALVAGSVAFGACWFMGQCMYTGWRRDHPPPRLRFFAEGRLRRDIARGLGDIEEYLRQRDPAHLNDEPAPPGRSRTRSRRGSHRR